MEHIPGSMTLTVARYSTSLGNSASYQGVCIHSVMKILKQEAVELSEVIQYWVHRGLREFVSELKMKGTGVKRRCIEVQHEMKLSMAAEVKAESLPVQ